MIFRQAVGGLIAAAMASSATAGEVTLRLLSIGPDTQAARTVMLEPISLRDLGVTPAQGSSAGGLVARGERGGLVVSSRPPTLQQAELQVRRQVPVRWQMQIAGEQRFSRPTVRVDSEGPLGQAGVFLSADGQAPLQVRLDRSIGSVVARDEQIEVIEGEVWVEFALDRIRHAGTYSGRLVFTLEHL